MNKRQIHMIRFVSQAALALVSGALLLGITASSAFAAPVIVAHAKVWKSDPGIGATIAQAPTRVTVYALENINHDPKKSNLQVYGPGPDATDTLISQGNAQVALSDPKQMSISITPGSGHTSGVYIVYWNTVSADDGDPAAVTFAFTVNSTGASSASTPSTQTPASAATSGTPLWVPIVSALAALVVGLGLGLGLGRRKPATSSLAAMRASIVEDRHTEETGKH